MRSQPKTTRGKSSTPILRTRKSRYLFLIIFTIVHMMLTALFFIWSYSSVLTSTQGSVASSRYSKILVGISDAFTWPVIYSLVQNASLRSTLPDFTLYIALLVNSLLWALVVLGIILWVTSLGKSGKKYKIR